MKIKIAVAQMKVSQFEPEKNFRRVEKFLTEATVQKADIICFPEEFLTGPILGKEAFVDDGSFRKRVAELAKHFQIDIVAGSIITRSAEGCVNRVHYMDREGKILGQYDKVHLWLPERTDIIPGHKAVVVQTRFGKIGFAVCWDLIFPELFRQMAVQGAEIIFCPSYWNQGKNSEYFRHSPKAEIISADILSQARAMENGFVMVFCNAAGNFDDGNQIDSLAGRTQISLPFMGTIGRVDDNNEGLLVKTVDTCLVKLHEQCYEVRRDLVDSVLS